jgi:hypothetical protein
MIPRQGWWDVQLVPGGDVSTSGGLLLARTSSFYPSFAPGSLDFQRDMVVARWAVDLARSRECIFR